MKEHIENRNFLAYNSGIPAYGIMRHIICYGGGVAGVLAGGLGGIPHGKGGSAPRPYVPLPITTEVEPVQEPSINPDLSNANEQFFRSLRMLHDKQEYDRVHALNVKNAALNLAAKPPKQNKPSEGVGKYLQYLAPPSPFGGGGGFGGGFPF